MRQRELAEKCGCSQSAISKAFRNAPDISDEMREKIISVARENGMEVELEHGLYGRTVLVITPEYNSEFFNSMVSIMNSVLWSRGFEMLVTSWEYDSPNLKRLPKLIRSVHGICGVITLGSLSPDVVNAVRRTRIPIVTRSTDYSIDTIREKQYDSVRKSIMHFVEIGRRRIAFVGEKLTSNRERCFRQVLNELGLPSDNRLIYRSNLRFEHAGADGFNMLFSLDNPPDAILCSYDNIAFGVMNAASSAGVRVPEDLAIVGFDNLRAAGMYRVGLTTVGFDHEKLCEMLVDLLLWRIRNPDAECRHIMLDCELIVRESG